MTGVGSRWLGHTHYSSVHVVLCVASMASLWALVSAQAAAPNSTYSPCPSFRRDLPTTVWGFLLALVALTVDDWGLHKNFIDNIFRKVAMVILACILNPFLSWQMRLENLMLSMKLMRRMGGTPAAKSYIKILSGCSLLVSLSPAAFEKLRHLDSFEPRLTVADLSDALVIGRRVQAQNLLELRPAGKEALLRADILPPVEQLKILQGYSGFAVAASAIQGVGYMYGIVVRLAQGLHVSPLEAIAFMLNLIVLGKAILHLYASTCHRPLLLCLEPHEEIKFTTMCEAPEASWTVTRGEYRKFLLLVCGGVAIIPGGVLMFFIIQIMTTTSFTVTIPLIIIEGAILLVLCFLLLEAFDLPKAVESVLDLIGFGIIPIMNFVGYVYGCVATIKYWESREFNIRSSDYLAQILPYLG